MKIHRAAERGRTEAGWLDSRHSFSFGRYHDPRRMGVGALRVLNDDVVQPGAGFDTHGHRDMEILSYVTRGAMLHRDSTGQAGRIEAGQFQLMHAGTGIRHSEFNASAEHDLAFLQIWILPAASGGAAGYEQQAFERQPGLQRIASPQGPLVLRQDAHVYRLLLQPGDALQLAHAAGRAGYLHVVAGAVAIDGALLQAGDAVEFAASQTDAVVTTTASTSDPATGTGAEALWFDLPRAG